MHVVVAKAYETWLTWPHQNLASVMFVRVGKSQMASRYFLQGRALWEVISKSAKSTVSALKMNLPELRMMRGWANKSNQPLPNGSCWWVYLTKGLINALYFVGRMRDNLIKMSQIAITKCYIALRCSFVPISSPRGDEGGEVLVVWLEGDTDIHSRSQRLFSLCCSAQSMLGGKGSVCGGFRVWHGGCEWVPENPLCSGVDHSLWHRWPCGDTMHQARLLGLVLGCLVKINK